MKITNKVIAFSIATSLTLSPLMVSAEDNKDMVEVMPINAEVIKEEAVQNEYINFEGKIEEVTKKENGVSILVKANDEDEYGMIFHLSEDVLLMSDKTMDFVEIDTLEEGMDIVAFYDKDTIMALSLPGQLTPDVLVVKENEEPVSVHVDKFNKELTSSDNKLKLNLDDKVVIVDEDGKVVEDRNLEDKDLVVFYTISTKSIPAQTTPEKVIILAEDELVEVPVEKPEEDVEEASEVKILEKMIINEKEVVLNHSAYKKGEVVMIPLRELAETLGYEVKWNNEIQSAELTKGAQWTSVKIGEDNYNFAKMLVKLGTAPEVKDERTFVPFTFLEEVLKVNVDIDQNGMAHIIVE